MTRTEKVGRKPHPSETAALAHIAAAVAWSVWFRKGPAELYREPATTLAEARAIAARLNAAHGQFGRRSIVYAISAKGAAIPVPDDYQEPT